ncbi:jg27670 [Pararge aegeria aegeria]|nr:jg27670 [Pararge aegeria aegeria]
MSSVFEIHIYIKFEDPSLQDYVLYSIVGNRIRGNFTPTSFSERPCRDIEPLPFFIPKHERVQKHKASWHDEDYSSVFRTNSDFDGYYFRPKFRARLERSVFKFGKRYRYVPAKIVRGPLDGRTAVLLRWSLTDTSRLESEGTSVVFR